MMAGTAGRVVAFVGRAQRSITILASKSSPSLLLDEVVHR